MEYSDRNLSLFSPWFLKAVKCISHCVSIEAPSLTTTVISPFCTLGILQWTSPSFPISSPNSDWQATFVLFCILSAYLLLSYLSPHAACVSWQSEQYAHVKVSKCTLAFYELMKICSIRSPFTELSCKLLLFYVQTHTPRNTLVMTTLLFLMAKMYFNYI